LATFNQFLLLGGQKNLVRLSRASEEILSFLGPENQPFWLILKEF